jgi:hypothetical protein
MRPCETPSAAAFEIRAADSRATIFRGTSATPSNASNTASPGAKRCPNGSRYGYQGFARVLDRPWFRFRCSMTVLLYAWTSTDEFTRPPWPAMDAP